MSPFHDYPEEVKPWALQRVEGDPRPHICNCIGPQNGQPLCPCQMRAVLIKDGRYVLPERDLGPVASDDSTGSTP